MTVKRESHNQPHNIFFFINFKTSKKKDELVGEATTFKNKKKDEC